MRQQGNQSRRGFVKQAMAGLTAGVGLPAWYAREVVAGQELALARARKKVGPNDRLVAGAIGVGGQGTGITKWLQSTGAKVIAVCDVDRGHRERAAKRFDAEHTYNDYRELLARDDIDVVTIATPDHWHTLVALEAIARGKDVYCEKPLTLTIDEGKALVKAARDKNAVFQVGSQQRSDPRFRLAAELVRNGRLGRIKRVETRIGDNLQGGPFKPEPVPDGLDWNFWLGQTPEVPYAKERCFSTFRWFQAYSGGKLTDWGAHHNDIAQWALGKDGSGPVSAEADGDPEIREPDRYNHPQHFKITYRYGDGTELVSTSKGENGVLFEGERGTLFVSRERIAVDGADLVRPLLESPATEAATRLAHSDDHMRNFVESVRSRERPICDVEIGHRSVTVCHLGNIALRLRRPLKWDPEAERFVGDDEANTHLSRPMRAPWKLES